MFACGAFVIISFYANKTFRKIFFSPNFYEVVTISCFLKGLNPLKKIVEGKQCKTELNTATSTLMQIWVVTLKVTFITVKSSVCFT